MRVLLTGASGFVGRCAAAALREMGHSVVAVVNSGGRDADGEVLRVDLLSAGTAGRIAEAASADALLHLAWTTRHGAYWNDLANLSWLAATAELVAAVARRGTRRVCVVGTCFEYDWPVDGDCDEDVTPTASHTVYDAAKTACRLVLEQLARDMHLSLAWARLFHLYGPGEHPDRLVSSVCRALVAGRPARCSSGSGLRDFMDVRDAASALAHLVTGDVRGIVNVASGETVRIRDVAVTLGDLAGRPELVAVGELPDRPDEPPRITASTSRLNREVGFQPEHRLRDGLNDALTYWTKERDRHG
ncbi:MAG: NAD(P)-dependent oxidoreductase [Xanthobacteraceae bacterium]|nr:NAD(P)-dependent oxidoreductase [Xanthobacteraceae bacterium]